MNELPNSYLQVRLCGHPDITCCMLFIAQVHCNSSLEVPSLVSQTYLLDTGHWTLTMFVKYDMCRVKAFHLPLRTDIFINS